MQQCHLSVVGQMYLYNHIVTIPVLTFQRGVVFLVDISRLYNLLYICCSENSR